MAKNRDDFTKKVIRELKDRVNDICSNPSCRVSTKGPKGNNDSFTIGVASHICAAAPGGPRYDASMSSEYRKSFENGIWLCANCATKIDKNTSPYSIKTLNKWKRDAEADARNNIGIKSITHQDALDMLTMSLTGFPKNFIVQTIENAHIATSQSIAQLDSRFDVVSSYSKGTTSFILNANVPVELTASINDYEKYQKDFSELIRAGKTLRLDNKDVTFSGSPIFEDLIDKQEGKLIFSALEKKALLKVSLVGESNNEIESLDDIGGALVGGNEAISFCGGCYDGLLHFSVAFDFKNNNGNMTFSSKLKKWQGIDISKLPFFKKVFNLYEKLNAGWKFVIKLEVDGEVILGNTFVDLKESEKFPSIITLLKYTRVARIISKKTNNLVAFTSNVNFTAEEHKKLKTVAELLESDNILYSHDLDSNPMISVYVNQEIKSALDSSNDDVNANFRYVEESGEEIKIFNSIIVLPKKSIEFIAVKLKIDNDFIEMSKDDLIVIELIPKQGFKLVQKYIFN